MAASALSTVLSVETTPLSLTVVHRDVGTSLSQGNGDSLTDTGGSGRCLSRCRCGANGLPGRGPPVGPHYAASKAGIIGLTHSCAKAFVKDGITVNAIAPALIETDMVTSNLNAKPGLIPMGRFESVDSVASVAVMLATNRYMTGQTIPVNGGWFMSRAME